MPKPIPVPATVGELLGNPQRIKDAFELLNALASLSVTLVPAASSLALGPGKRAIVGDPPLLTLPLPLQLPAPISNPTGGATIDAQCRAALVLLLTALRGTKQLPP